MFSMIYPPRGRGAWPTNGVGGTLNGIGTGQGSYYRAPAAGSTAKMPGLAAALTIRNGTPCSINAYAVYAGVRAIQQFVGPSVDGIFGKDTSAALKEWQGARDLTADGVAGPATCRVMFGALAVAASFVSPVIRRMTLGTISVESGWDPGAVGVATPQDLGLGQISGPAHPSMSVDQRFAPSTSIPWVVGFVTNNLKVAGGDEDLAILSYNLGGGGAKSWAAAGRPALWNNVDVIAYINRIKAGGSI